MWIQRDFNCVKEFVSRIIELVNVKCVKCIDASCDLKMYRCVV